MTNELERIGQVLGINNMNDYGDNLCLLIQDKIKKKDKENKKKDFCNVLLKEQVKKYEKQIHNLKNEYAESVGIQEYMMLKKSYENLKGNYNKTLEGNHNLRKSIEQYRENELNDRLKRIIG